MADTSSRVDGRLREVERERDSLKATTRLSQSRSVTQRIDALKTSNGARLWIPVRQLEKEKYHAIAVSEATAKEYQNLGAQYRELEVQ